MLVVIQSEKMQELPDHVDLPRLETERLVLRKLTAADAEAMFAYASDPEVARTTTWEAHASLDATRHFLRLVRYWYDSGAPGPWGIVLKAEERLIGTIGLTLTRHHRRGELGYAIGRAWWGQGLATEAARAAIRYGFDELDLQRIEAHCLVDNLASERVMQKCGMTYEGTLRDYGYFKGAFRTLKVYAFVRAKGQGPRAKEGLGMVAED
jgi:ribosomal-protein-alanine N-acetyltransferase